MNSISFDESRTSSLRRATPNTCTAQRLARQYDVFSCSPNRSVNESGEFTHPAGIGRTKALQVAKRAAAAMGLKSTKIALIDQLFGFTKSSDWMGNGAVPIVWPSNALLSRRMGISVSTVRYHLRGLAEAGLVAYSDHPTYQRSGRRDAEGNIIEAFGINLSPIAMRFDELNAIAMKAEYDALMWRTLSQQRTVLRKEIAALILCLDHYHESIEQSYMQIVQSRLEQLRERSAHTPQDLEVINEQFEQLRGELEEVLDRLSRCQDFDTAASNFEQHTTTAINPSLVSCNIIRHRAYARSVQFPSGSAAMALEIKPSGTFDPQQACHALDDQSSSNSEHLGEYRQSETSSRIGRSNHVDPKDDLLNISLPLLKAACPAVLELIPAAFASWPRLFSAGRTLCDLASINPQVFAEASDLLGPDLAITALTVTVERAAQGIVTKPGAYLRTLTQRGQNGELHLSKSLFALAAASVTRMQ